MEDSHIVVPKTAVLMVSPRDYRLSSLSGYCMIFRKDVPVSVPPQVYREAIIAGITECEDQPEPKEPVVDVDAEKTKAQRTEAAKLETEAAASALVNALTIVVTRNDPEDFKADGTPKANKVIAEMAPEFARPTATAILDAYGKLQENMDLAED